MPTELLARSFVDYIAWLSLHILPQEIPNTNLADKANSLAVFFGRSR
jgi:hypothetical protein